MSKTVAFKFEMGDVVEDRIDGFSGVVVARTEYMTGCKHYGVKPQRCDDKGAPIDWQWIDETYLNLVRPAEKQTTKAAAGGPAPNPPQA